jgi:hypothetical protein
MPTAFKVGDLVGSISRCRGRNPDPPGFDWEHYLRQEVQIEILTVEPARITARVTVLGDFFSSLRLDGTRGASQGFVLGEALTLRPAEAVDVRVAQRLALRRDDLVARLRGGSSDNWVVDKPPNRPWHSLSCQDGVKTFEHYR